MSNITKTEIRKWFIRGLYAGIILCSLTFVFIPSISEPIYDLLPKGFSVEMKIGCIYAIEMLITALASTSIYLTIHSPAFRYAIQIAIVIGCCIFLFWPDSDSSADTTLADATVQPETHHAPEPEPTPEIEINTTPAEPDAALETEIHATSTNTGIYITSGVLVIVAALTFYSLFAMRKWYTQMADDYQGSKEASWLFSYNTFYPTNSAKEERYSYERFIDRYIQIPGRLYAPVLTACALLELWILFMPNATEVLNASTPSRDSVGWFLTVLIGAAIGALPVVQCYCGYQIWQYNRFFESWQEWVCMLIPIIVGLQLEIMLCRIYSIGILFAAVFESVFMILAPIVWIRPRFEYWYDEKTRREQASYRGARYDEPSNSEDYDYGDPSSGGSSSSSSTPSSTVSAEYREYKRRSKERTDEDRRSHATPYDCVHYRHGLGREGCHYWKTGGDIEVDPCEYSMCAGACPHFKFRN